VIRDLTNEIADESEDLEVLVSYKEGERKLFQRMRNYFPHLIRDVDALKRGQPVRRDVLANMVHLGEAADSTEAEAFVDDYIAFIEGGGRTQRLVDYLTRKHPGLDPAQALARLKRFRENLHRHGSLEYAREVDLPIYDPDPLRVLPTHLTSASIRLAQIAQLGQDNQVVNKELLAIELAGGNREFVEKAVDRMMGVNEASREQDKRLVRKLLAIQAFKLTTAAIPNATQSFNTLLATDFWSLAAGIRATFGKKGWRFAVESGATIEPVLHEAVRELAGSSRLVQKYLKAVGFTQVERMNRVIAANAGAVYAGKLLEALKKDPRRKRPRRVLLELGVDVDRAVRHGSLSANDVLMAAKRLSDITQFRARPEDLPGPASDPLLRLAFQFKSFAYQQARFLKQQTFDELRRGEIGRGLRALLLIFLLAPALGEGINALRAWLTGREREYESLIEHYLDDIAAVGSLGIFYDLVKSAQYGRLVEAVAGPSVGMVGQASEILVQDPTNEERWKKWALRQAPFGSLLKARLTD
jgi:hypothetical protein